MTYRGLAVLAALAATVSCSDDPTAPTGGSGTFAFTFGGTMVSGSYSATGDYVANQASSTQAWAAGFRETGTTLVGAVALQPKANARYDMAILSIDRNTAGTSTVDANCDPEGTSTCTGFGLFYNFSDQANSSGEIICALETGSVTIASIDNNRMSGSFSGSGTCVNLDTFAEGTFTVSSGSFNVPMLSDASFSISSR